MSEGKAERHTIREDEQQDGPQPIRYAGYVVHALGRTIWLTPASNSDQQSDTRH